MLKVRPQDNVNAKKYGCRREHKIKVKVLWSSNRSSKCQIKSLKNRGNENNISQPINTSTSDKQILSRYAKQKINKITQDSKIVNSEEKVREITQQIEINTTEFLKKRYVENINYEAKLRVETRNVERIKLEHIKRIFWR